MLVPLLRHGDSLAIRASGGAAGRSNGYNERALSLGRHLPVHLAVLNVVAGWGRAGCNLASTGVYVGTNIRSYARRPAPSNAPAIHGPPHRLAVENRTRVVVPASSKTVQHALPVALLLRPGDPITVGLQRLYPCTCIGPVEGMPASRFFYCLLLMLVTGKYVL